MKVKEFYRLLSEKIPLEKIEMRGKPQDSRTITPDQFIRDFPDREIKSCTFYRDGWTMTRDEIRDTLDGGKWNPRRNSFFIELEPMDEPEPVYKISRKQWNAIPDSYKTSRPGEPKTAFKCFLTPDGSGGDTLCIEGQHFIIDEQGDGKE